MSYVLARISVLVVFVTSLVLCAGVMEVQAASYRAHAHNYKAVDVYRGSNPSDDIRLMMAKADGLLGSKYSYGSEGPSAFDCSGFTKYVFKGIGMDLPHSADDQAKLGHPAGRDDLVAGDLVFFSYYGSNSINHVGIYLADNKFIHASTKKGVIYSSLGEKYYADNYKGARRLVR